MRSRLEKLRVQHTWRAQEAIARGNLEGAERAYTKALALEATSEQKGELYMGRARVRMKRGRKTLALQDARTALELAEADTQPYFDANALVLELDL
jgi:Flp pilus assembly protein TadD